MNTNPLDDLQRELSASDASDWRRLRDTTMFARELCEVRCEALNILQTITSRLEVVLRLQNFGLPEMYVNRAISTHPEISKAKKFLQKNGVNI